MYVPQLSNNAQRALHAPTVKGPSQLQGIQGLFQNEDAMGAALFIAATQLLSLEEMLEFDPRTIKLELQDALKIPVIDGEIFGRLMAATSILSTDLFYQDLPAFIEICNTLSGTASLVDAWDPADPWEIGDACIQAAIIDTPDNPETNDFSEEIRAYVGMVLQDYGFFGPPALLKWAIMPEDSSTPSDVSLEADLLPGVIESENIRQEEFQETMLQSTRDLVKQIESVVGRLDFTDNK